MLSVITRESALLAQYASWAYVALASALTGNYIPRHVRQGHPEQRTASLCHRRWHQRARQPHAQLSAAVERCAEPGLARHPPRSQDRRGIARSAALGTDPVLVQ